MALVIKKTLANGTAVDYHRISKILIDFNTGKINVIVSSYIKDKIRDTEKIKTEQVSNLAKLRAELDELVRDPTKENEAKRQELSDKVNDIADGSEPHSEDLSITVQEFSMNVSDGYTQKDIYTYLKSLPDFAGAKDC